MPMPIIRLNISLVISLIAVALLSARGADGAGKVVVWENGSTFTLDNGIVAAAVGKRSGDLLSLRHRGTEMLDTVSQHQAGYWSHNTARSQNAIARITIDPTANGGER